MARRPRWVLSTVWLCSSAIYWWIVKQLSLPPAYIAPGWLTFVHERNRNHVLSVMHCGCDVWKNANKVVDVLVALWVWCIKSHQNDSWRKAMNICYFKPILHVPPLHDGACNAWLPGDVGRTISVNPSISRDMICRTMFHVCIVWRLSY
jgi:hypothetical protein